MLTMNVRTLLFAVLLVCFVESCISARIAVLYAICSKSHMIAVMPAIEELAERGHQVTVISPFKGIGNKVKNGREIFLSEIAKEMDESDIDWFAMQKEGSAQFFTMLSFIKQISLKAGDSLLNNQEFREIVEKRDVDLFIVDGLFHEFLFPIFDLIGVPFVMHSSSSAFPSTLTAMGAPIDYASIPLPTSDADDRMTFTQRLMNIIPTEIMNLLLTYYIKSDLEILVKSHFPSARPIAEMEGEASIIIVNSHPMTNWPRSLPPTMVPIGALHTRPANPLPQGLKEFADGATEGLIVFTLGSFVPVSSMPKETLNSFIRVFSKLPQRVVWKWETDVPLNMSSNIMMVKWLPQQDLLGHPNTRVFISHGGMLGTQEAAYHGVPMLGLPFGNDQRGNIAKVKRGGWGLQLDWDKIDDRILTEAFTYLIHDPNVRTNASRVSALMRDQLMPGKDVAVYWIEYVIRHGSTKHLQLSSKNMPFYQRHLLDVCLFLITIVLTILFLVFFIIRLIFRSCLSRKAKKD